MFHLAMQLRFEPGEAKTVELVALVVTKSFMVSIIKLMANYKVGRMALTISKSTICSNLWPNRWR